MTEDRDDIPHICIDCGEYVEEQQVCPYDSEINSDYTLLWLCDKCADLRAWEI